MDDELAIRRKRLLYQAHHRGTHEGDLVVGGFADRYLHRLDSDGLDQFEALIRAPDPSLMDWVSGRAKPPEDLEGDVFDLLIEFKNGIPSG